MRVQIEWNENKPALIAGMVGKDGWIVCESCEEPIKKKYSGIAVFDSHEELPASPSVRFFHKRQCDPRSGSWNELHEFFEHLQNSLIED